MDSHALARLFPQLVELSQLAVAVSSTHDTKQELASKAVAFKSTLSTAKTQIANLKYGDLSVEDEFWLIEKLKVELETKRSELKSLKALIPTGTQIDQEMTDGR